MVAMQKSHQNIQHNLVQTEEFVKYVREGIQQDYTVTRQRTRNLCTDDLLKKLGLSDVRMSINIKTLNGDKKVKSSLIEGLMVSKQPLSKDKKIQWVKLPKLYSREHIPVDSAEIATPEKLKKWRYLDSIAKDIARDDKVSVDLLSFKLFLIAV